MLASIKECSKHACCLAFKLLPTLPTVYHILVLIACPKRRVVLNSSTQATRRASSIHSLLIRFRPCSDIPHLRPPAHFLFPFCCSDLLLSQIRLACRAHACLPTPLLSSRGLTHPWGPTPLMSLRSTTYQSTKPVSRHL